MILKGDETMGRHFEVRAASMAKTAAAKAKLYSRYGKEILVAAKNGVPDPDMNAALKKVIERAKANQVPADVIKRAIDKAKGGTGENYSPASYEGFGSGGAARLRIYVHALINLMQRWVSADQFLLTTKRSALFP